MFKQFTSIMDKIVVILHSIRIFQAELWIENSISQTFSQVGEYEKLDYDEKYAKIDHRFLFSIRFLIVGWSSLWRVWPL